MTAEPLVLGDAPLTLEQLAAHFAGDAPPSIAVSDAGWQKLEQARRGVEQLVEQGHAVYGVNTGFGHLKNKRIPDDQLGTLQQNLLISHAVGVGPMVSRHIVRWLLILKTHMLLQGHSGVRREVIERVLAWLDRGLVPAVPSRGSLGASGDLAPLAHAFLPLIGRGELVHYEGEAADSTATDLPPLALSAKEGLALINGTQLMSAYAVDIAIRASWLLNMADLILCMSLEGIQGSIRPADPRLHLARPHPGAQTTAANIRHHMQGSEILAAHADCDRVQDRYSFRCAPQVHGAVRDALAHFRATVEREINSVTDNPVLFGTEAISGGNFHGAPLAYVLDYMAIALTDLGNISERRIYALLSGEDNLPKLLMQDTGLNSGFMIPQYTAAALLNECKVLATPASIDSIPTSLGQEDHVSMGGTSATKCHAVLDLVEQILAIELLCAAQAMDYRAPLKAGNGPEAARTRVRERIPHAEEDREFGQDIRVACELLRRDHTLRAIAAEPAGK
jgi:histidine ammonia-lyase